jgi:hypothetical protein
VDAGHVVGLPLGAEFREDRKLRPVLAGELAAERGFTRLEEPVEGALLPKAGGARIAAVFDDLGGLVRAPAEDAAFVNRMQGVDEDLPAADGQARRHCAFAESAQEVELRRAGKTSLRDPGNGVGRIGLRFGHAGSRCGGKPV